MAYEKVTTLCYSKYYLSISTLPKLTRSNEAYSTVYYTTRFIFRYSFYHE